MPVDGELIILEEEDICAWIAEFDSVILWYLKSDRDLNGD